MLQNWLTIEEVVMIPVAVLVVLGSVTFLAYRYMNKPQQGSWTDEVTNTETQRRKQTNPSSPLQKIWDYRYQNENCSTPGSKQEPGKPFGSSYYYAHNSLRKTGGYSDGLRMEDYQMETPRLLSRNGVSVLNKHQNKEFGSKEGGKALSRERARPSADASKRDVICVPIKKYLWDDPGDEKATGTIRIEHLDEELSWSEANVTNVEVDLQDEIQLTVIVYVKDRDPYRLHIPQLFGKVKEIKKVSKSTRLMIRLVKRVRRNGDGKINDGDIVAWPTPSKKSL